MAASERLVVDEVTPELERLVPPGTTIERIPVENSFAEGPVWNARDGYLLWTDAFEDRIMKWAPGRGVSTFMQPTGQALALAYDRERRLVATGWSSRTIWRLEADGSKTVLASHYQGKKINTPNDLVVRSDGSIYWTDSVGALSIAIFSPDDLQQYLDSELVFRLSADGSEPTPVADGITAPNGIAFSPDQSILYVNSLPLRHIYAFDVRADGTLANRRLFYEASGEERGGPDGMKVDQEGNIYCTGPGGVHVIDRSGRRLGRIRLTLPTNMCFGEDDWQTLFVTTRSDVFRFRVSVPGVPV
jgi:gluconolactonase